MRIYGDRVVSSDLRGEDVNFILGRFKLLHLCFDQTFLSQTFLSQTIVVVSQQKFLFRIPSCLSSKISAYASMKKTKHFVYVHLYSMKNLFLFIFITRTLGIQDGI